MRSEAVSRQPTVSTQAELVGRDLSVQIVQFEIPVPATSVLTDPDNYQLNMCLTPRPVDSRAGYFRHWGAHRWEKPGDIIVIPPAEELRIGGGEVRQNSLLCRLSARLVHEVIGHELAWDEQKLAATLDITSARIRALLFRLAEEVRHPGLASDRLLEFMAGELAVELGRYCLEVAERPVTGGLAGWRLRLIDERLEADPRAPSLDELAGICNISIRQLTRGFKVSRACSIGDYVEQRRMETARRMLMAGDSVKEIAFALGFSSPSSFTFAFRRAVGSSPSEFRQRQLRGIEPIDA
jgi:AraC family transcriptional regulator